MKIFSQAYTHTHILWKFISSFHDVIFTYKREKNERVSSEWSWNLAEIPTANYLFFTFFISQNNLQGMSHSVNVKTMNITYSHFCMDKINWLVNSMFSSFAQKVFRSFSGLCGGGWESEWMLTGVRKRKNKHV